LKNKTIIILSSALTLLAIFFAGIKYYQSIQNAELEALSKKEFLKFVPNYAPKLGPESPQIYLVEFLDPECESCREFYPYVKMLLKENEGKIQLVIRYAPFHGNSKFVIRILEASRKQGKYWEVLENLFQYQPLWGSHHDPKPDLVWKYLPEAGVDIERIKIDMLDPAIDEMIAKEVSDAENLGVRGTPTFFVNGKMLQVFGYEPLRELIQTELSMTP
jgi:protein-disulfide isomerase